MQVVRLFACLLLATAAFAAEIRIKVIDPQSAAVAGARVELQGKESARFDALRLTSAQGLAVFTDVALRSFYRAKVMAPGFAPAEVEFRPEDSGATVTVKLSIARVATDVVVSAARTPLPADEAGADTASLGQAALVAMQPVAAADALEFLPGAVVSTNGRRGGLASLFVRGGESRYNKVLVDDVAVNDPGGTFDFGVVPMDEVDRLEFVRGAESTLYGSDAMTSVVQVWTRTGSTLTPELRFGGEGGTFSTARGYSSLAGARGRFDYNLFGEQFNTEGQGVNDAYSNSSEGVNVGVLISPKASFRLRSRHANSRSGVQSFWNFNGEPLLPPDTDQRARQNNFLASTELDLAAPGRWQHRFSGFEYHHRRSVVDTFQDPGRVSPLFGNFDFPFSDFADINRAGFEYQGDYWARDWARTTFGYHFEDENGFVGDLTALPLSHGLRRNHAIYGQQFVSWRRVTLIAGARFVHNESFGNKLVPRVAAMLLARRGGATLAGTRLRFSVATGIKEPRLEESFGIGGYGIVPNPNLKPEENRSFEAGFQQDLVRGRWFVAGTYFNNLFRNRIDFSFDPATFTSQYVNLNRALAHGAELEVRGRLKRHLSLDGAYTYTSTQILQAPLAVNPLLSAGAPLLRRPKHSGTLLLTYGGRRWGGDLGGTFVGRRADSDFEGLVPPVTYAAGYGRLDLGGWYALTPRMTAYIEIGNALNRHYEEAAGYPALRANFRAGMRFRVGGE